MNARPRCERPIEGRPSGSHRDAGDHETERAGQHQGQQRPRPQARIRPSGKAEDKRETGHQRRHDVGLVIAHPVGRRYHFRRNAEQHEHRHDDRGKRSAWRWLNRSGDRGKTTDPARARAGRQVADPAPAAPRRRKWPRWGRGGTSRTSPRSAPQRKRRRARAPESAPRLPTSRRHPCRI